MLRDSRTPAGRGPPMAAPAVSALQFRAISNAGISSAALARSIAKTGTMAAKARMKVRIRPSPATAIGKMSIKVSTSRAKVHGSGWDSAGAEQRAIRGLMMNAIFLVFSYSTADLTRVSRSLSSLRNRSDRYAWAASALFSNRSKASCAKASMVIVLTNVIDSFPV